VDEAAEDCAAADAVLGEVDRCRWAAFGPFAGQLSEASVWSAVGVVVHEVRAGFRHTSGLYGHCHAVFPGAASLCWALIIERGVQTTLVVELDPILDVATPGARSGQALVPISVLRVANDSAAAPSRHEPVRLVLCRICKRRSALR
jgi:hypothetical protein